MTGRTRRLALLPLIALPLLLSACGQDLPQDSLDPAGPQARTIDALFNPVFWIAVGVFVLVEGLLVVALIKFRHRPGRPMPHQVHGNKRLEVAWTIAPAVLLAGIAVPTIFTIFSLAERPSGNVLEVNVTAHQWWWEIEYPGLDVVTANELHIPVDRPVYIQMDSDDVLHSFWVPRLAGKQDIRPDFTTYLTVQADDPGVYLGQCAEFCGAAHADMRFRVVAQIPDEFDGWVRQQLQPARPPPPDVLALMTRMDVACQSCHMIRGVQDQQGNEFAGTIGPDLTHFGGRTTFAGAILESTPENLADWLRNPQALKPDNDMTLGPNSTPGRSTLTEEEIQALIAYLETLE